MIARPGAGSGLRLSANRMLAVTLTLLLLALTACNVGESGSPVTDETGGGSSDSLTPSITDPEAIAAAQATAQAFADGEWDHEVFYHLVPDGVVAYSLEYPAGWFVEAEEPLVLIQSHTDYNYLDADVGSQVTIEVIPDAACDTTNGPGGAAAGDNGLGEPSGAQTPPADAPWEESWSTWYDACRDGVAVTVNAEVCCTTQEQAAAAHLALVERVLGSFRFVDLPLADATWDYTHLETDQSELDSPGGNPPRSQATVWSIAHPTGWSVAPVEPDSTGWELSGEVGDPLPDGQVTLRVSAATDADWRAWRDASTTRYGAFLRQTRRLTDEVTPEGRRVFRYLVDGGQDDRLSVTVDVPDLGEGSEGTALYEQVAIQLLMRTSHHETIMYPDGYPGRQ